ncbi:flagellar biosynthesis anti-sigma factor FlgM [Thalassomonas viridans]|uniref:Negative regulator of flagellin synthesis n=2 Tax=Thalassomonas viridans TaxID=137584 RepID=A0AAE9Z7Z2_9GAMM|nr:flagellar biosynthesis anti-sigma factor FlgM [Thalassomonas viridans]
MAQAGLNSQTTKVAGDKAAAVSAVKNSGETSASVKAFAEKADNFFDINNKLSSASDVDMEKVNQVRELIAQGNLSLDLDVLSDAILEMHRR